MTPSKWLRLCGAAVSAAMVFLFSCVAVNDLGAQTAESAMAGSAASSPFVVAPSIPLGYAPSSVAAADMRRSGTLDLVTADYSSGKITVFLGSGQGRFASGMEYYAGLHPSSLVVADINGDGRPDVLVANDADGTVSVLLGKGDGTLLARKSYALGFNPAQIAAGDFNGNGKMDVAVTGAAGKLALLLNDGNGNLQAPVMRALGKAPTGLAIADLNGDGRSDLALSNSDGTVSILLGKGAGQFEALRDINVGSGSLSGIAAADFDRTGKIDLVVTQPGNKLVSVLMGKGDGTFLSPVSYPAGNEPVATLIADVHGDGIPALVVINKGSNTFSILAGNGDGTFRSSADYVAGNAPLAAVAGDFYGNGHADLAIINHSSQSVSLPLSNGDGTFKAARSYTSGMQPAAIVSGNLSGNKIPALVVANRCGSDVSCASGGNVAVFLADEKGDYHLSSTYNVGAGPVSLALADLNGDKNLDIVALNRTDKTASVLLGIGDGTFRQPVTISLAGAPVAGASGVFTRDGIISLAIVEDCGSAHCSQAGIVELLRGSGDGSFQSVATYPVGYAPVSIAVGDINGDKNLDLIVANRCGEDATCKSAGTATVLIGDGSGKFKAAAEVALGNSPSAVALGRLTGSNLDLLVSRSADNTVAVLHGNGDGTFQKAVPYPVGSQPGPLVVADFNGDGRADAAVANSGDSTVSVLFGHGDGTLQAATAFGVGAGPEAITTIGPANGKHTSLGTANGNSGSPSIGTDITVLANFQPAGGTTALTSFTLTSGTNPSNVNAPVLLTATLVGTAGTPPAETVTFDSNGTAISDCTSTTITYVQNAASGTTTAKCTTSSLTVKSGGDALTAAFPGDATYLSGTSSPVVSQTVKPLAATLGLTSPGASNVNASVTFTAQLNGVTLTPVTPSGMVDFKADGTTITGCGAVAVDATGAATCSTSVLTASGSPHSITAVYSGDPDFTVASPGTLSQTVNALTPTLSISASPSSTVSVGTLVTFTAQLSGTVSPVTPVGTVTWSSNTGCAASTVNASGAATCATSSLVTPADVITATYSGDSNYVVANPGQTTETVNQSSTAAVVTPASSPVSPSVNQPVTFSAQVWAPASEGGHSATVQPKGSVTFTEGGITVCSAAAIVSGTQTATCAPYTFASIPSGSTLSATFTSADSNFPSGTTGSITVTVQPSTTTTMLSSSPSPSAVNQQVNFTATVTPTFSGTAVPQGTVVFATTNPATPTTTLCTETLSNGIVPPCPNTFATVGSTNVYAIYTPPASTSFSGSVSTADSQVVNADPTTTTVTAAWSTQPATLAVNQQVTFTATVAPTYAGATAVAGTVSFTYSLNGGSSLNLCNAVAVSASKAMCVASLPTAGSYTVTASYAPPTTGAQNFSASLGSIIQPVGATATTTSVSGPASLTVSAPASFTATITPVAPGSSTPTGTVTFTYTTSTVTTPVVLCPTVTVSPSGTNGTAGCSTSLPAAGIYTIVATYTSGDTNFTGSSGQLTQTVGKQTLTVAVTSPSQTGYAVNQAITFTATMTPSIAGATSPTQTVTFTDTTTSTALCTVNITNTASGTGPSTATCTRALLSAGAHTITASYGGDINYPPVTSGPYSETIVAAATAVTVTSSLPVSVATQPVVFTATVTQVPAPSPTGTALPNGTVAFTTSDGSASCSAQPLSYTGSTGIATCNVTFPKTTSGSITVTATFNSSDNNFAASNNSGTPFTQAVQNFGVGFTAPTSGTVILTQGYANGTDPFNPVAITVASTPVSGFNDPLNVTCTVTSAATGDTVSDPTCSPASATLAGNAGTLTYSINASASAVAGKYSVTIAAVDSNQVALSHSTTLPLSIYIVPLASPLVVTAGVTGTENVVFDTAAAPAGSSLVNFACGTVVLLTNGVPGTPQPSTGLTCKGPSGGVAVGGVTTTAQISISPVSTATTQLQRSATIYAATLLGMPLLALLGWVGSRKSSRRNFFRVLGLVLLVLAASYAATGCGGSYTRPPLPPTSTFAPGSYYVQVVATDANGNSYYAVVPLTMNQSGLGN